MGHIHTQPGQHDLTVSAFIVRDGRVLLHRHKTMGVLMQPGGHVELDEDPWQALAHEVAEETGYAFPQLRVLQPSVRLRRLDGVTLHPQPACVTTHEVASAPGHFHTDLVYAFVTDELPRDTPSPGESSELRWVDRAALAALGPGEIFTNVREIGLYVLDEIFGAWAPVQNDL